MIQTASCSQCFSLLPQVLIELTRCAVIDIHLTVGTHVARAAGTSIAAEQVGAGTPVSAWILVTLINVNVTTLPYKQNKTKLTVCVCTRFPSKGTQDSEQR